MKTLSIVGTAAMFLVGGGIVLHGIPQAHSLLHHTEQLAHNIPMIGSLLTVITPPIINVLAGIVIGTIVFSFINAMTYFRKQMHNN